MTHEELMRELNRILSYLYDDEKPKKQESVELKICPRCNEMNPSYARFCAKCWMPLIPEEALKMEEKEKAVTKVISGMISDEQKALLQNLPPESKIDVLATLLIDMERTGQLDRIKERVKPEEQKDEPEAEEQKEKRSKK